MKLLKEWIYKDSICAITENELVHILCGYASVTADHPLFGKKYHDIEFHSIHGGLTYSGDALNYPVISSKGSFWWFGFDFGHYGDFDVNIEDVVKEAEKLADILFLYIDPYIFI